MWKAAEGWDMIQNNLSMELPNKICVICENYYGCHSERSEESRLQVAGRLFAPQAPLRVTYSVRLRLEAALCMDVRRGKPRRPCV